MEDSKSFALVTGAGKGLGRAIAIELACRGRNVLLIAREGEGLNEFCVNLKLQFGIEAHYLEIDFLKGESMNVVKSWIDCYEIDFLVNNAGVGGSNFFESTNEDILDAIIQVNVKTLALLTRMLISKLKIHRKAYILNVGSMASCCPIAYKTVYPASKAFVYSFSKGLSVELSYTNISVSIILPGPIKTNQEVSQRIEKQGWWVKAGLWSPQKVAKLAVDKSLAQQRVIIPGLINKINWMLLRVLPVSLCSSVISMAVKNEIPVAEPVRVS